MYNPDYELSDKELLAKYGLKLYSNHEELSLQVTLLYCLKNGYSLRLDEDIECQVSTLLELKKVLPEELAKVLGLNISRPHRYYDPEIAMSVYKASRKTEFLDTPEYSQLLVALIQNSEPFILNGCCDYRQTLFLASILKENDCNCLDYDEKKYPFLRVILSDKVSLNYQNEEVYRDDVLYRFLINELSAPSGIYPPKTASYAEPSISGSFYDNDGSLYSVDEYMETVGGCLDDLTGEANHVPDEDSGLGCNFTILSPSEFSQTFFRFIDRYEFYDCVLVPCLKGWQNSSAKEREIQSCIEERLLSQFISDGQDAYILLQGWGDDKVRFKSYNDVRLSDSPSSSSVEIGVPYGDIVENQYSLNPYLYMVADCDEAHRVVRLKDICSIDEEKFDDFILSSKSFTLLPDYVFAKDLIDVFRNAETKQEYGVEFSAGINRYIYCGPHIHITKECEFILSNTTGYYACPVRENWALCVNDTEVSAEYLTYVLLNSEGFKEFLASEPSAQTFLNKKVAILRDYKAQEEAVLKFKANNSSVVKTSHIYNVALLVPKCPDWIKITMEECWYLKIQEFEHVQGVGGLLDILDSGQATFDAVIVDAVVDSVRDRYKGLRNLMAKVQGEDTPIYLYTDVDKELLQDDLSEQEYQYFKDGRYFDASDETVMEDLVRNLRNELDGQDNKSARMRGEFIREFEAASWLDSKFPKLSISSTLTYALTQPNKSFTALRGVLNRLYRLIIDEIRNGFSSDQVQNVGMLPSLLKDGFYIDKGQTIYLIHDTVMPLPLALALRYASDIANGAVHEEDVTKMNMKGYLSLLRSEHLAHTLIRIIMDFILWLKEVDFEFDGYCTAEDINTLHDVKWCGILEQESPDEYYCQTPDAGKVHVNVTKGGPKGPINIGEEIVITKVKNEIKFRQKYKYTTYTWDYKKP